jgi:hypothetical protein
VPRKNALARETRARSAERAPERSLVVSVRAADARRVTVVGRLEIAHEKLTDGGTDAADRRPPQSFEPRGVGDMRLPPREHVVARTTLGDDRSKGEPHDELRRSGEERPAGCGCGAEAIGQELVRTLREPG